MGVRVRDGLSLSSNDLSSGPDPLLLLGAPQLPPSLGTQSEGCEATIRRSPRRPVYLSHLSLPLKGPQELLSQGASILRPTPGCPHLIPTWTLLPAGTCCWGHTWVPSSTGIVFLSFSLRACRVFLGFPSLQSSGSPPPQSSAWGATFRA